MKTSPHRASFLSRRRRSTSHLKASPSGHRRLGFESLEDRRMLAVITVTSLADELFIINDGAVTLREAIQAANDNVSVDGSVAGSVGADTIKFSAALSGNIITLVGRELKITESITIDAKSPAQNITIDAQQVSRIFNITATTGDFALAGLTLTGGRTGGDNAHLLDTRFSGGAVRSRTSGNLTIDQSIISGNYTQGSYAQGGGVFSLGNVTFTDSTVFDNATGDINLNPSNGFGGGIFSFGDVTLISSTVSENNAKSRSSSGGGITAFGDVTLTNSTVSGNKTQREDSPGGGIYSLGNVTLTSSTVSGNSTGGSYDSPGGGIFSSGDVTLTSSTVSGNSTRANDSSGGGILSMGDVTLTSSTVAYNYTSISSSHGGGIWNSNGNVTISHSIVAGNTAGGAGPDTFLGTGIFNVNYSLLGTVVSPDPGGIGNLFDNNPLLGPLRNYGGPTETHALLVGSPALDAGDPSIAFDANQFDQRGAPFVRVVDDATVPGFRIDIGAYERQTFGPSFLVVTTSTDELDYSNNNVSLREAIHVANNNAGADTILFDASLSGNTITLGGTELVVAEGLTIDTTAIAQNVTIDALQNSRIFNITATTGDFTFAGLTLTRGWAFGTGGAVRSLTTGSLTIDQSTISGSSTAGTYAPGGGIFAKGDVTLTNSTVRGNSTTGSYSDGGGIHVSGVVTLTSSTVRGNSTTGNAAKGGGIRAKGVVTLTSSTVSGNSTAGNNAHGGGIHVWGVVTLTNSSVSGNSGADNSGADGGGIYARDDITLTSSTVSGNGTGGRGGGFFTWGAVTLTSSTVTNNHAHGPNVTGGGIKSLFDGPIILSHSIVAGNTAGGGNPDIDPGTGSFTANFSLLGTAVTPDAGSSGNLFSNTPLLGPLANNGGPTKTHALLAGGLAIDAGNPGYNIVATPNDQRGAPFVRGAGTRVDIGAYERQTVAGLNLTVDTLVDETDGDYSAGDLSLREAIGLANGNGIGTDTITFDAALSGGMITLGGIELDITEALTIDATAIAQNVTIDANNASRIFNITANTGDFTLAGLTLTGGQTSASDSAGRGGAIRSLTSGTLAIVQSTVSGNSTTGIGANGGGISALGNVTLISSTLSGNSTTGTVADGGGVSALANVTVTSSTVSGNSTAGDNADGGGIYAFGDLSAISSTISGNSTAGNNSDGGGIYGFGDLTVTNSTITDNHATDVSATGGGIWNNNFISNSISLSHSILAGNMAGGGSPDIRPGTGTIVANFSLLGTAVTPSAGGSSNLFEDTPLLGLLANNGGPTETHALLPGSPAIDMGDPNILFNATEFDQRGTTPFVRVFDGGVNGQRIDIGALELQPVAGLNLTVDTLVDEDDGDFSAGDLSLREAIGLANSDIGANTIMFDASLAGNTITLGGTELEITEAVTIDATALANNVSIDANNASRIFNITATTGNFTLAGLTLTGGRTIGDNAFSADTTFDGGAIRSLTTGNLTIDQSNVSNNNTTGKLARGGAIRALGDLTLTGSTVSGNSTAGQEARAGGVFTKGSLTLTNSTVSGNSTMGFVASAGGIYSFGTLALTNSTVSGNSTTGGFSNAGGIVTSGAIALMNSTITDNHAYDPTSMIGGIVNNNDPIAITNSILAGNTAGGGINDIDPGTGAFTVNYSLIGSGITPDAGTSGNNVVTNNPLLGALSDNGGPTQTHAPLPGSPAINAGDPNFAIPPNYDQRGFAFERIIGGRIDIGAFESGAASADFDSDGDVDGSDFLAWQRGFGTTPVVHAEGDANLDAVVDATDLTVWQNSFGISPAPLAAALVSSEQAVVAGQHAAALAVTDTELVDAALAIQWLHKSLHEEEAPAWNEPQALELALAGNDDSTGLLPSTSAPDALELPTTFDAEAEQLNKPWLAEELLESVFG